MAYSLYIERSEPITIDEWLAVAKTVDNLNVIQVSGDRIGTNPVTGAKIRIPGAPRETVILRSSELEEWIKPFHFWNGRILIKPVDWDNPKSTVRVKAFELARKLSAEIIGDQGEKY